MDADIRASQSSHSFRESSYLIPTPAKRVKHIDPLILRLPLALGTPVAMLALGIALEIALMISMKRGGFSVPPNNAIEIVSAQFLLSFFPTILVIPFAFMWRELDWTLRWLQPYVVLIKGKATAEESISLDYVTLGPFLTLFRTLKYKHRLIFWSSLIATTTYIFQPLAGSIFQVRQRLQTQDNSVTSVRNIGLIQDVAQLNAFVAAAGFAEAAVFHHLPDPPFVQGGWATAEFVFPAVVGLNGTMDVNTTAIKTTTDCANPEQISLTDISANIATITSKSVDGCTHTVALDPSVSAQQYGVDDVPCPGNAASQDVSLRPVMFWYFHTKADGTSEARTVFCTPSIQAFDVMASASLNNGSLYNVVQLNNYVQDNNVTGGALAGHAYNGVIFSPSADPFVQARANATRSGVPGAVFRFASQLDNGPQSSFDLANGFLDITSTVYTQYLSFTAQSIYFVRANSTLPAVMRSLVPRLWIDPLPAHTLALFLILTGFIGVVVQFLHRRHRRHLFLAAPPGNIAAAVAQTSHSGFGELLFPYDDEATIERKLDGLRFRLDRRTGAILADEVRAERPALGPDDAMLALLGQGHERDATDSSHLAYQAAAGYPPWKTPYDP